MFGRIIQRINADSIRRDGELIRVLEQIIKQQELSGQVSFIEQQKEILAYLYQKSSAYANLIIIAGYAGMFAIWQFTRDSLKKDVVIWVAVLLSCSITIFAAFEVFKMIDESLFLKKLNRLITAHIPEKDRVTAWRLALNDYSQKQSRIWIYPLVPTVLTGFSAGFILIYQLILNLTGS